MANLIMTKFILFLTCRLTKGQQVISSAFFFLFPPFLSGGIANAKYQIQMNIDFIILYRTPSEPQTGGRNWGAIAPPSFRDLFSKFWEFFENPLFAIYCSPPIKNLLPPTLTSNQSSKPNFKPKPWQKFDRTSTELQPTSTEPQPNIGQTLTEPQPDLDWTSNEPWPNLHQTSTKPNVK